MILTCTTPEGSLYEVRCQAKDAMKIMLHLHRDGWISFNVTTKMMHETISLELFEVYCAANRFAIMLQSFEKYLRDVSEDSDFQFTMVPAPSPQKETFVVEESGYPLVSVPEPVVEAGLRVVTGPRNRS